MNKKNKIMIVGNPKAYGAILAKNFDALGFNAVCKQNKPQKFFSEIVKKQPDIMILCFSKSAPNRQELVKKIKETIPDTKIIVLSYVFSSSFCEQLIENGADRCIIMPATINEIYFTVWEMLGCKKIFKFEWLIMHFLIKSGFTANSFEFRLMCTAIGLCLCESALTEDITGKFYPALAETYGISTDTAEHCIRNLAEEVFRCGAYKSLIGESVTLTKKMSNYELICAAASSFASHYKIYDDK